MSLLDKIVYGGATLADQNEACKDSFWAYWFALNIMGADIEKCQAAACKSPYYAYIFAHDVKGADIEKCQKEACKDPKWAYYFALNIKDADLVKIIELCPEISNDLNEIIMNKALL